MVGVMMFLRLCCLLCLLWHSGLAAVTGRSAGVGHCQGFRPGFPPSIARWVAQVAELHRLAKRQVQLQLALASQQRAAAAIASYSMYPFAYGGFPTMPPLAPAAGTGDAAAADTGKPAGAPFMQDFASVLHAHTCRVMMSSHLSARGRFTCCANVCSQVKSAVASASLRDCPPLTHLSPVRRRRRSAGRRRKQRRRAGRALVCSRAGAGAGAGIRRQRL